jgi:hypothetical protein
LRRFDGSIFRPASVICTSVPLAAFLSAPPWPEQDCQNDRPNDAPADPRDVWVRRLPFEDLPMDGHECDVLPSQGSAFGRFALSLRPYSRSTIMTLRAALDRFSNECDGIAAC